MGMIISLRKQGNLNFFRRNLLNIISIPIRGRLLICSAYFSSFNSYSVFDDEFGITLSDNRNNITDVVLISGMGKAGNIDWPANFKSFYSKIVSLGIPTYTYTSNNNNWHAKVVLKLDEYNRGIAGIIGSSNLTKSAFGEGTDINFNYEADTIMWSNIDILNTHFYSANKYENKENILGSPMFFINDSNRNGYSEEDKLTELYNEIVVTCNIN